MVAGTFLFTLTSFFLIWKLPLGFLLGVRVLQGVACAFFYTAAVTFVANHSPEGPPAKASPTTTLASISPWFWLHPSGYR